MEHIKTSVEVLRFREYTEKVGYSASTQTMLVQGIRAFLEFYADKKLHEINSADILRFYEYLHEKPNKRQAGGLSENYIYHHMYSIKVFFNYQEQIGTIHTNPTSSLEFKRTKYKSREILTQDEITYMYQETESLQERAILALYYGCGLRRTEGILLNLRDIHFRSNLLFVRKGKGNKSRVVPMSEKVAKDVGNYIRKERIAKEGESAVLTNKFGCRTTAGSCNKIIKQLVQKTGIDKQISLHCLRHSIATHLLENGMSVEYVRDFLGHKHLESTQVYTRINKAQLFALGN